MKIRASIDFWGDGVVCFCHEALIRAVAEVFPDAQFEPLDVALKRYQDAAAFSSLLERSAWSEFLRNGPRYRFTLASGTTGVLWRWGIRFELPETATAEEVLAVRQFLAGLTTRPITVAEE
jgi:hypothetical protein